jgi:cytochrome P450 family 135
MSEPEPSRGELEFGAAAEGLPLPPGPTRRPLARSLHWFRDPVGFIARLQERHGPVFRAPLGPRRNTAFVGDPRLVRSILATDPDLVRTGDGNGLMRPVLGANSLLVIDGEEHRRHRAMMLPAFHNAVVREVAVQIAEITEECVERWPRGRPHPLHEEMRDIAFATILRVVFGFAPGRSDERLADLFGEVMDLCSSPWTLMPYFRRELGGVSPYGRLMRMVRELHDVLDREIRERLTDPGLGDREDALSILIRARDGREISLTDAELRDELMTMLVAGHETTAAALSWAFERLARHPEVTDRIADPAADGDPYLDAVIREVLRQRPLVPALVRKLVEPAALGGYGFPAGWVLMPAVTSVHADPELYPDPERFLPERFMAKPAPPAWAWITFGGGNRRCVGASLAMLEMRVVLRTVLARVSLEPARPRPERIVRRRFTLAPEQDATVVVRDRPRTARRPVRVALRPSRRGRGVPAR